MRFPSPRGCSRRSSRCPNTGGGSSRRSSANSTARTTIRRPRRWTITRATQPEVVERVRALVLSSSSDAIAGAIGALMTRPDSGPLLSSIRCPTLVAVGEEDTVTPRSAAEAMHRAIAGSELVTIPQAGHLANLEQPAAFNAALARFLEHRV